MTLKSRLAALENNQAGDRSKVTGVVENGMARVAGVHMTEQEYKNNYSDALTFRVVRV